ncbi:MAG: hypothetical protein AAGC70_05700 [Pseudomonadota bacterium]
MTKLQLRAEKLSLMPGQSATPSNLCAAIWVEDGHVDVAGQRLPRAEALDCGAARCILNPGSASATVILFSLDRDSEAAWEPDDASPSLLLAETIQCDPSRTILRLDRVTFPPGAVAYRHVHSGPGIRYLTMGALDIQSDAAMHRMRPGNAWFEDADSPVRATADAHSVSEFVRVLLLPDSYLGRPTLKRLNPEDFDKPTLQTNHRYFDTPLSTHIG